MTSITYTKVHYWDGVGYLLSIPRSVYPAVSRILYATGVVLGDGVHITATKTKKGWVVYKHVVDDQGAHAGYITAEELERFLTRVAEKYNQWKQKRTLDEWLEV